VAEVQRLIKARADVQCVPWGGYPSAERCRILFGREDVMHAAHSDPGALGLVTALQIKGNFMFDAATHRDFLGACLGTGIDRRVIGDVLVQGDKGAQLLCTPEMVPVLQESMTSVRCQVRYRVND
jgi:RNA-binding protein YlmH